MVSFLSSSDIDGTGRWADFAELIEILRRRGGGTGLFTGCAAGDTGAAVVLRIDE